MAAFTPAELSDDEALVLLALVRLLVIADGEVTVAELAQMNDIGRQLGIAAYARAATRIEGEPVTSERAIELARTVTRQEARQCIFGLLVDLATADEIDYAEAVLIEELRELWAI